MLTKLALVAYNPNKAEELVSVRNTLIPKILNFLATQAGMSRDKLIVRVQRFDTLPHDGLQPGWRSFQDVRRTKDPLRNELISITCYQQDFPVALRKFIFAKNYGRWINPERQLKSDNPKDATTGTMFQTVSGAFIDLTIDSWSRLLRDYRV